MGKSIDLVGQKFNKLLVLEKTTKRNSSGTIIWKCQCDCGNITEVITTSLKNGHTKSCGCYSLECTQKKGYNRIIDRIGQTYGKLTVLSREANLPSGKTQWKCRCDCGNELITTGDSLQSGKKRSCGCLKTSWGEEHIAQILTKNNIPFVKEKTFEGCSYSGTYHLARFDFYVNNQYLIEFDGKQHFDENAGWGANEFSLIQARDQYKNNWCKENNIPLIRIPYTQRDSVQLEDLVPETSKYLI